MLGHRFILVGAEGGAEPVWPLPVLSDAAKARRVHADATPFPPRCERMDLFYDPRDDPYHERAGSQVLYWLDDLGARPLPEATADAEGFLFAGARPLDDYRELV